MNEEVSLQTIFEVIAQEVKFNNDHKLAIIPLDTYEHMMMIANQSSFEKDNEGNEVVYTNRKHGE